MEAYFSRNFKGSQSCCNASPANIADQCIQPCPESYHCSEDVIVLDAFAGNASINQLKCEMMLMINQRLYEQGVITQELYEQAKIRLVSST